MKGIKKTKDRKLIKTLVYGIPGWYSVVKLFNIIVNSNKSFTAYEGA